MANGKSFTFPNPTIDPNAPPIPQFLHLHEPFRGRPAEYIEGFGWIQGGWPRTVKKKHYHFIWPKDGKNGTKWGRVKDILKNQGPDIHMTISADKMDYMYNRQRKSVWSRHQNLDAAVPDVEIHPEPQDWTRAYDFRTRKYRHRYPFMWTDSHWQHQPNSTHRYPKAIRNISGEWFQNWWNVPPQLRPQVFGHHFA